MTAAAAPEIERPRDAVVRVTRSCIRGSDLHLYNGSAPDTRPGMTFGHEATALAGIFGYSHTAGGYDGREAEDVRVPYAVVSPTVIPEWMDPRCRLQHQGGRPLRRGVPEADPAAGA